MLVVNADDLGLSEGATLGIVRAHREGVVTSASLVTNTPDYRSALETCARECPGLGLGLHFTLSAGRPVADPDRVPLLADQGGFMRWRFGSLFRAVGLQRRHDLVLQIELELEAQLDRLIGDGVEPDHIDSERHVHLIPGIFERVVAAAERRGIPFVRMGRDVGWHAARLDHFAPLVLRGGIVKSSLLARLARRNRRFVGSLRTCDNFASYMYSGRLDLIMPWILGSPPDGLTEVMVHPGIPEASRELRLGNVELERYLRREDRRKELNACIAARALAHELPLGTFREAARGARSAK